MTEAGSAAQALEHVRAARAAVAERATCPAWKHPVMGGLMGALVVAQVGPAPLTFAIEGVCALGAAALFSIGRQKGMWVNGYRRGRTRPVIFAFVAAFVLIMIAAAVLRRSYDLWWAPFVGGLVTFVLGTCASLKVNQVYRRELLSGESAR